MMQIVLLLGLRIQNDPKKIVTRNIFILLCLIKECSVVVSNNNSNAFARCYMQFVRYHHLISFFSAVVHFFSFLVSNDAIFFLFKKY